MKDEISVSQSKYLKDMLKKFGLEDAKPIKTPMGTNGHLDLDDGGKLVHQKLYRSMIGSLLYITASRPESCLVFACVHIFKPLQKKLICPLQKGF